MKGIIHAGGLGPRQYPLTLVASKQLHSFDDKPMEHYHLTTMIEDGIRDLCLIPTPHDPPRLRQGVVSPAELEKIVGVMPDCEYRAYLENDVVAEAKLLHNPS